MDDEVPMFDATDPDLGSQLSVAFEMMLPSDLLSHLDRRRPYVACVIERRAGLPSNLGNPASRCLFCCDEYPELCPPHLHERGDQT
jgi:hypothetical protein